MLDVIVNQKNITFAYNEKVLDSVIGIHISKVGEVTLKGINYRDLYFDTKMMNEINLIKKDIKCLFIRTHKLTILSIREIPIIID